MVMALFFITALALTATIIVWVSTSEKRVSFNQYAHTRAFYSSDAGSESALNWLYINSQIPVPIDGNVVKRDADYEEIHYDSKFKVDVEVKPAASGSWTNHAPGYESGSETQAIQVNYIINSDGASAADSEARIEVMAARIYIVSGTY